MARNGTNKDKIHNKSNLKFNVVGEYYSCAFGDKIQHIGVQKTKQGLKRIFRASKCGECPYHEKCTNLKFKEFRESAHPLILEIKKNFISAVEIFMYQYRGIFSEGGFGTLKNARQYPDLKRRGKQKADMDLKIEAIVDNLIKIRDHLKATLINLV